MSHNELFGNDGIYMYYNHYDLFYKLKKLIETPKPMSDFYYKRYDWSIERMLVEMGLLSDSVIPTEFRVL